MNFSRLFNKDLLALLISILFSIILFFNNKSEAVTAIKADFSNLITTLSYPQKWYKDIFYIKEFNQYLEQKLVHSNLLNAKLNNYKIENSILRKMLNFKDSNPWTLVPANVTNRYSLSTQTIILNVGENNNINKNLPVLDTSGLLGKTIAVGEHTCQVQLITDKNFSVSIKVGDVNSLGNFVPTVGKFGILQGIRKSVELFPGQVAYTSGISEIYPGDIPVARIISVNKNNNNAFQDVNVELLSDLNNLNYVFIIQ